MVFDLSGIWYRIYTEVPFFLLAGTLIFLADFTSIRKKQKMDIRQVLKLEFAA